MPTVAAAAKAIAAAPKRDRLHLRLDLTSRNKIEEAAFFLNKTASEFVVTQAVAAAERVIESHRHTLSLSEADWDLFCQALANPPEPTAKLTEAAHRYAERGGEFAG